MPPSELPSVVCAWCGQKVRDAGLSVSHGICQDCTRRIETSPASTASRPTPREATSPATST